MAALPSRSVLRTAVVSLALVGATLAITPAATADTEPAPTPALLLDDLPCIPDLTCPDPATPPDTTITGMTPMPNGAHWVNRRSVTVSFDHSYAEGGEPPATDKDGNPTPTTYECELSRPGTETVTRTGCVSPTTFTELTDTALGDADDLYTITVRAVHPDGITKDDSPATTSFRLDATAPRMVEVYNAPELVGPGPFGSILLDTRIDLTYVASGAPASYRCTFDGSERSCPETGQNVGRHTVEKLGPGAHRFTANAVDQAGNRAPNPQTVDFAVPYNRVGTRKQIRRMWNHVAAPNHHLGDYVVARKNGSFLSRRFSSFTEAHLVVAKGPKHGRIRVDLGATRIKVQRLGAKRFRPKQLIKLNLPDRPMSGRIKVTVISPSGRPVMIDAIVVR